MDWLEKSLLTSRYEEALATALKIPECPIVPFFGSFVKKLTVLGRNMPSLVVLAPNLQGKELQKHQEVRNVYNLLVRGDWSIQWGRCGVKFSSATNRT